MPDTPRWYNRVGAWVGIGASPGALLLGAHMASRHNGVAPLIAISLGIILITLFTYFQGIIGLTPPHGENAPFSQITPRYTDKMTQKVLGVVLAAGMIGWFGFNAALGSAAISSLTGIPHLVAVLLISGGVLLVAFAGFNVWNLIAVATSAAALVLMGLVSVAFSVNRLPVTLQTGGFNMLLVDAAAYIGYLSVFSVRAPDFTHGLPTRRDLIYCIMAMVIPVTLVSFAGVALQRATASTDLVGVLASARGLAVGNAFVALSIIGPLFTTVYSGAFALQMVIPLRSRLAMVGVVLPGLLLAITRFDRRLNVWLAVLAAMLPPFVLSMALEAFRRRRGLPPRQIPLWTWMPASLLAITLTMFQQPLASLLGLGLALLANFIWHNRTAQAALKGHPYAR